MYARRDPGWFDPSEDYSDARFALARIFGTAAAKGHIDDWPRVERILSDMWLDLGDGMDWSTARSAAYATWRGLREQRLRPLMPMNAYRCPDGSYILLPIPSELEKDGEDGDACFLGATSCDFLPLEVCISIEHQLATQRYARVTRAQFYSTG
jgi:hypothetical protein